MSLFRSIASRFPFKLVSIRPEDFPFGRSLNRGCAVASGEFIVIASAHVYPVYEDWLEKLLAPFADPSIALTYGKQRGNENRSEEHTPALQSLTRHYYAVHCLKQKHNTQIRLN